MPVGKYRPRRDRRSLQTTGPGARVAGIYLWMHAERLAGNQFAVTRQIIDSLNPENYKVILGSGVTMTDEPVAFCYGESETLYTVTSIFEVFGTPDVIFTFAGMPNETTNFYIVPFAPELRTSGGLESGGKHQIFDMF